MTTSGTLTAGFANQAQNSVLAAPTSGAGLPSFRSLALGDLPLFTAYSIPIAGMGGQLTSLVCTNLQTLQWTTGVGFGCVTASTTDATKLPLAGGTMTAAINMNAQNITNIGNVGVGITNPNSKFELLGTSVLPSATTNAGVMQIDMSSGTALSMGSDPGAP